MRHLKISRFGWSIALLSLIASCTPTAEKSSTVPTTFAPATPSPVASGTPIPISGSTNSTGAIEQPITVSPSVIASSPPVASTSGLSSQGGGFSSQGSTISGGFSPVDRALQDLGATVVGNEIRIDLPADVLFDFDKSNIRPDANAALQKLLTIINAQSSSSTIQIEGHTDAIASDTYNQTLSERRASAVEAWLSDRGIASTRMTTEGFGESQPVAPNTKPDGSDNSAGRQKNRRVEIVIRRM